MGKNPEAELWESVELEDEILATMPLNVKPRFKSIIGEVDGKYFVKFYKPMPNGLECSPGDSASAHVQEALVGVYEMY